MRRNFSIFIIPAICLMLIAGCAMKDMTQEDKTVLRATALTVLSTAVTNEALNLIHQNSPNKIPMIADTVGQHLDNIEMLAHDDQINTVEIVNTVNLMRSQLFGMVKDISPQNRARIDLAVISLSSLLSLSIAETEIPEEVQTYAMAVVKGIREGYALFIQVHPTGRE